MKKRGWYLLFFNPASAGRVFHWAPSRLVLLLCGLFLLAAAGGLARLTYFACSCALAKFGLVQEQNENQVLMKKMHFLAKFAEREGARKQELAAFENTLRTKYGMEDISADVRLAGVGGKPTAEELAVESLKDPAVRQADSIKRTIVSLLRQEQLQYTTLSGAVEQVKQLRRQWAERPSVWPTFGQVTSFYGFRTHPITGYPMFHEGLDIANESWTPVFATGDGYIRFVGREQYYGNMVIIDHPSVGYSTVFGHLIQLPNYIVGQEIKRGDLVGYMGNSGRSTGTHLHYEIRKLDKPIDPLGYIVPSDTLVD
jgi:murein DD-endopeptidase MepM/ murein hydrolase activator NlpD